MLSDSGADLDVAANVAAMKALQHHRTHGESVPVIYSTKEIAADEIIEANVLEVKRVLSSDIHDDSFLSSKQQLIGRTALRKILADRPVNIDDLEAAEPYYQRLLQIAESALGSNNMEVARLLGLMAESYWSSPRLILPFDVNKYVLAEELNRRALSIHEELCGKQSPEVGEDCVKIAHLCKRQEKWSDWKHFLDRALIIYEMTDQNTSGILAGLAAYYENEENNSKTEQYLNKAVEAQERILCRSVVSLQIRLYGLADLYCKLEKSSEAELVHRRIVAMAERMFGTNNVEVASCLKYYGKFLQASGRAAEAEQILAQADALAHDR